MAAFRVIQRLPLKEAWRRGHRAGLSHPYGDSLRDGVVIINDNNGSIIYYQIGRYPFGFHFSCFNTN